MPWSDSFGQQPLAAAVVAEFFVAETVAPAAWQLADCDLSAACSAEKVQIFPHFI